jgi:thiol-disulfide isomerase/thioredoxin
MKFMHAAVAAAALFATAGLVVAQPTVKEKTVAKDEKKSKLKVGDKAPEFKAKIVKGDTVTSLEKGKVYVVEFWATWCPPCLKSIPHLSELQKQYKDQVTIIGVACKDYSRKSDEQTESRIKSFAEQQGEKMSYRVAFDDGSGKMNEKWMDAAGKDGIPTAFVVDGEGKIAYIGSPQGVDAVLAKLVKKAEPAKDEKKEIKKGS